MKRKACMVIMALLVATSLFAGAYKGDGRSSAEASAKLNFSLNPEDVNSYRFGFTAETIWRNPQTDDLEPLDTVELKLNPDKKSATSIGAPKIYFAISADKLPTLTLEAGKGLHRDGLSKLISYDVVAEGKNGKVTVSSGQAGKPLPLGELSGSGFAYGTFGLTINTTTDITPDMASNDHDWEDTITLSISSL